MDGSELTDDNQYLPQWFLIRDNYNGSKTHAYIRFVNSHPQTPELTVKVSDKLFKSSLMYPRETDIQKVTPGLHFFRFFTVKFKCQKNLHRRCPKYPYRRGRSHGLFR